LNIENGRRIKFNIPELLQAGVSLPEAITIIKQLADDPEAFQKMGLRAREGFYEVGVSFVSFLEKTYERLKASEKLSQAA
jgi:hypothetical protein